MKERTPKVSAIITTKNSGSTLDQLLKSIKNQSYPNIEIIVVDNRSSDQTVNIAKKFTNKVFNRGPERSAQRNFGAKKAVGSFYLFLDSDMVLTKHVIRDCVAVCLNNVLVIPEKSFGIGFWSSVKAFEREINLGEPYFEAARFFPKKIFWNIKGFDENLTGPEDWDLHQAVVSKYPLARIKSYILHNEGKTSLITLMKKKYYYGLSADKYFKKQEIPLISAKTIYFLRPAFYKKWRLLVSKPTLTAAMVVMLSLEMLGGGFGYLIGKINNGK